MDLRRIKKRTLKLGIPYSRGSPQRGKGLRKQGRVHDGSPGELQKRLDEKRQSRCTTGQNKNAAVQTTVGSEEGS